MGKEPQLRNKVLPLKGKPRRAVFLDRDGTMNRMVYYPGHGIADSPFVPSQLSLLPRVIPALRLLKKKGFLLVMVSNQPGLAKGQIRKRDFEAIDRKMDKLLAKGRIKLDAKYYSFFHKDAVLRGYKKGAHLRKPKPGMLLAAAREHCIDLGRSYMVGDGVVDVKAGKAAGCKTVFLGSLKPELWSYLEGAMPDLVARGLFDAARKIK